MPGPDPGMILDIDDAIDYGAYAHIFRPSRGPLACKLFISVRLFGGGRMYGNVAPHA
jgi:hypothetical protein